MSAPVQLLSGSTLLVEVAPTIAIDVGKWNGLVVRVGREALDASTVGPVDEVGERAADALRDLDDWEARRALIVRVLDRAEELWDRHEAFAGPRGFRVVVETVRFPAAAIGGSRRRPPIVDWLTPREVAAGVIGRFPRCVLVTPQRAGARHQPGRGGTGRAHDFYPPELIGARPARFAPSDSPRGVRDHEQAAFDLAALAHLQLSERPRPSADTAVPAAGNPSAPQEQE